MKTTVTPVMFQRPIRVVREDEVYTALGIARLVLTDDTIDTSDGSDTDTSDGSDTAKIEVIVLNKYGEMFTIAAQELVFEVNA